MEDDDDGIVDGVEEDGIVDEEEVAAYDLMDVSNDASPRDEELVLLLLMVVRKLDRNRVFTSSNTKLLSWDVIDEDARVRDDEQRRGALRCRLSVDFDTLLLLLLLLLLIDDLVFLLLLVMPLTSSTTSTTDDEGEVSSSTFTFLT